MSSGYQQQEYKIYQRQKQEEALIEYYVYQDIQNLINLLYSRKAVLEHFQNDQNNPIVTLSNNKIILQLNLSNGIHKDLQYQYQYDYGLSNKLRQDKNNALQTLKYVTSEFQNQYRNQNDPIENYVNQFIKNYESDKFELNQFQLLNTNHVAQFNEQVLSKVISSMQTVDAQTNQLRQNGNYDKPTPSQLVQRAHDYYNMTKEKLNKIYPQNNQTNSNNKQQKNSSVQEEYVNIGYQQSLTSSNNQSYFNNEQKNNSRVQECDILNIGYQQQQTSSNNQPYFNNEQQNNSRVQECDILNIGCPQQQTSSNTEQQNNSEKNKLIQFFQLLGYFSQTTKSIFQQEIGDLYNQANYILSNDQYQSYPGIQFIKQKSQFKDFLINQIILHYYFQLFRHYLDNMRQYQNQQIFQDFVWYIGKNKKNNGTINDFFQYLLYQKALIEQYFDQNTQNTLMNNSYNREGIQRISEEDYVWQMYKGFCKYYWMNTN